MRLVTGQRRRMVNLIMIMTLVVSLIQTATATSTVTAAACSGPVSYFGEMKVNGNQLVGSRTNSTVMVKGMSLFWSNWSSHYWNTATVNRMVDEFKVELIRAAYGVDDYGNPYNMGDEARLREVVYAAINRNIYVIIDWHSHGAHHNVNAAKDFFGRMAQEFGHYDNVIFEIYNEPTQVSWHTVKSYAEQVIPVIRQHSDNLIVVGTPTWSQDVDQAANNRITSASNIAYSLHFYAGTHGQSLRDKANYALNQGIALFVTEWGTVNADGDGGVNYNSTNEWLDWMNQRNLSWANWAVNDKYEGSSIFYPNGTLTPAGNFLKAILHGHAPYAPWRNSNSCS